MKKEYKVFDLKYGMCKKFKTKKGAENFYNKTILSYAKQDLDISGLYIEESEVK